MDAGVRVFKLEGRARGPEYVRLVTECYKEAVQVPIANGTFDEEKDSRLGRAPAQGLQPRILGRLLSGATVG